MAMRDFGTSGNHLVCTIANRVFIFQHFYKFRITKYAF
jgi:hypothetical protein